jgi:hypothetical protein
MGSWKRISEHEVHNLETRIRVGARENEANGLTYLFPIGAEPALLRVEITEVPSLQKRIVAETDPGNDVASAEGDLLRLSEVLVHAAIQNELPDVLDWDELLWPDLCRVKDVEIELMFPKLGQDLSVGVRV